MALEDLPSRITERQWRSLARAVATTLLGIAVLVGASGSRGATTTLRFQATLGAGASSVPGLTLGQSTPAWCGSGETPANRLPQPDALHPSTIRVIYAYPVDVPDRFRALADAIVSDVSAVDAWWRGQDPSRALRWDVYAFPGCPGGLASLDLGVIPLAHESAYYAVGVGFERLLSEVAPHLGPTEKALVFFDGFVIDERVCGVSEQAARYGGEYGLSVVSLRSGCWVDVGAGAGTARIAIHELGHNLGAVPSKAPNRCADAGLGGHVCDSPTDLMFPYASRGMRLVDAILDVGRDDYYAHASDWWDVQDSAWLVRLPLRTLEVLVSGAGSVSSSPAVIACPGGCTATLESDFPVVLTALAEPGSEFYGWKGACKGEADCRLEMVGDLSVQARFGPPRPMLVVRVTGKGRVTSVPSGVACPGRCSAKYLPGTRVALRTRPLPGWRFERWSGPCGAKSVCAVSVTSDRSVRVTFVRASR